MPKARYNTLHEWLDRTGTNQRQLLAMLKNQTGRVISAGMLSMILRGSRRCSVMNAMALHLVTGVPIKELTRWPRSIEPSNFRGAA